MPHKNKLSKTQIEKRNKLAEKLKGKKGIKEPFAVATNIVKKKKKKKKKK